MTKPISRLFPKENNKDIDYKRNLVNVKLIITLKGMYDNMIKILEIDNIQMKLEFWDTAGQERFRSVIQQYYNDSQVAVVVFYLSNPKSFHELKFWVQQLRDFGNKMLLGNKSDMLNEIKNSSRGNR